jgi:hypothetical protein
MCPTRRHDVGARVWLWELLPNASYSVSPVFATEEGQIPT